MLQGLQKLAFCVVDSVFLRVHDQETWWGTRPCTLWGLSGSKTDEDVAKTKPNWEPENHNRDLWSENHNRDLIKDVLHYPLSHHFTLPPQKAINWFGSSYFLLNNLTDCLLQFYQITKMRMLKHWVQDHEHFTACDKSYASFEGAMYHTKRKTVKSSGWNPKVSTLWTQQPGKH